LLGLAEILAIGIGILLGIIAASRRGTRIDVGTLGFSLVTYAMPSFWLGMIMVSLFSVGLNWFPVGGMESPGMAFADLGSRLVDILHHSILPIITMSILLIGEYALTMRNTLMDVLSEDYITTAKAKGFGEKYILRKHAVPNAMLPMVTIVAMNLGLVVGGAIQIETIFSWPGLGTLMYAALTARDYPLLQGLFLLITVSVIIANYIADLTYTYIDPRVKE
jgi:peptide/nickel transport system permease protein